MRNGASSPAAGPFVTRRVSEEEAIGRQVFVEHHFVPLLGEGHVSRVSRDHVVAFDQQCVTLTRSTSQLR